MNLARLIRSANPLSFNQSHRHRLDFIKGYEFPPGLGTKFAKTHDSLDDVQQEMVFAALRDYFVMCQQARQVMVSMPSQVVDDAWHEFILFTKDYCEFCTQAFGRYLHHTPAEAMETKTMAQHGIRRAWKLACENERIHPGAPSRLPRISLSMPCSISPMASRIRSIACPATISSATTIAPRTSVVVAPWRAAVAAPEARPTAEVAMDTAAMAATADMEPMAEVTVVAGTAAVAVVAAVVVVEAVAEANACYQSEFSRRHPCAPARPGLEAHDTKPGGRRA